MKVNVVISRDGRIRVGTREGTFAEGTPRVEELLALLGETVPLTEIGQVEQHRHDHPETHAHHHHHEEAGHAH